MDAGDRGQLFALTGYAQNEDRERAMAAGFEAHLPRPVSLDELGKLLDREP
jgi:CheY-like chemotaxis protein